ncbi:MAG: RICIN domain-containing protein [Chitinophagaceae bacterium]
MCRRFKYYIQIVCWVLFFQGTAVKVSIAQFIPDKWYHIIIAVGGENYFLTANNQQIEIAINKHNEAQQWQLLPANNGHYKLINKQLATAFALDVVNNAAKNKVWMAKTAAVTGQSWKLTPINKNNYQLSTAWLGSAIVLGINKQIASTNVQLVTKTASLFAEQVWTIALTEKDTLVNTKNLSSINGITTVQLHDFKIKMNDSVFNKQETITTLHILNKKLLEIKKLLPADIYSTLTKVAIWLEVKKITTGSSVWYHSSKGWLKANGYPEILEKSIEIKNMENFNVWSLNTQPYSLLHELAHAYHDMQPASIKQAIANRFKVVMDLKLYDSVAYANGNKTKHYATNSEFEFFAELTEAYFGKNDYFPFNRTELMNYDNESGLLIKKVWQQND